MTKSDNSHSLFTRSIRRTPGGVNSPVRAWKAVGAEPRFIAAAHGAYVQDEDGNRLLDYVGAFGPAILGHGEPRVVRAVAAQAEQGFSYGAPTRLEVELAEMIAAAVPGAQKVRLQSSGTEAGMTALRIARAATGRSMIIKFDGCYHGHSDSLLVRAGSGAMTLGVPDSPGVPADLARLTLVARYNDLASVERCFSEHPNAIAAVIVEPVAANMGVVKPAADFLQRLGALAHRHCALFICDEVISGFRLRFGAAYEIYGGDPDLIMLGKIIGGGNPIGAVAGRAELMDLLAPAGAVYQAGTLSGNPLSVRAGIETLKILSEGGVYERLETAGACLEAGLSSALAQNNVTGCVNRVGSLVTLFLGVSEVQDAEQAQRADRQRFAHFFNAMLERGIYLPPSQFEALFISNAHSDEDLQKTVSAACESLVE
ncbi:MAG TPA: glutamate-1-semialdehyde 2,1-aminomutase [Candidatus Binataceae bacterium]|nr:glutamate-1-semialdehyde 2,1-aminomutase [Candidatus Binataceae bacterium]